MVKKVNKTALGTNFSLEGLVVAVDVEAFDVAIGRETFSYLFI